MCSKLMNVPGCLWLGSPPWVSRCCGCPGGPAALWYLQGDAPWMHHGVNTTFTWASAKLLPHGGAFTLDLTTKRHLQSAERQLREGGLCSPLPWSMKSLCLVWGCADMDTMAVLMPADPSAFSGTEASWIPAGSHGSSFWPGAAVPGSAQLLKPPSWTPAEKASSALHHIQQGLPHSPTQLCQFQAFCWFSHQTGC